jgi:hypothetical protein
MDQILRLFQEFSQKSFSFFQMEKHELEYIISLRHIQVIFQTNYPDFEQDKMDHPE